MVEGTRPEAPRGKGSPPHSPARRAPAASPGPRPLRSITASGAAPLTARSSCQTVFQRFMPNTPAIMARKEKAMVMAVRTRSVATSSLRRWSWGAQRRGGVGQGWMAVGEG